MVYFYQLLRACCLLYSSVPNTKRSSSVRHYTHWTRTKPAILVTRACVSMRPLWRQTSGFHLSWYSPSSVEAEYRLLTAWVRVTSTFLTWFCPFRSVCVYLLWLQRTNRIASVIKIFSEANLDYWNQVIARYFSTVKDNVTASFKSLD